MRTIIELALYALFLVGVGLVWTICVAAVFLLYLSPVILLVWGAIEVAKIVVGG